MRWVEAMAPRLQATIIAVLRKPNQPVSCLLSFKNVPSLNKAVKQSNGHPNMVKEGATGGVSPFRPMPRVRNVWQALVGCHAVCMLKALIYAYSRRTNAICSWGFNLPRAQL